MLKSLLQLLLDKFTKKSEFNSLLSSAFIYTETDPTIISLSPDSSDNTLSNLVTAPFDAYVTAYAQKPSSLANDPYWAIVNVNSQEICYSSSSGDSGGVRTPPILVRKGDTISVLGSFMSKEGQNKQLRFFKFNR